MTEEEIKRAIREEKNRQAREWRRKNPDKVRAQNERYWRKKAMAILEVRNAEKN